MTRTARQRGRRGATSLRTAGLFLWLAAIAAGALVDWRLGAILAVWLGLWRLNTAIAQQGGAVARYAVPAIFGVTLLILWQMTVTLYDVPGVILPAPTAIAARIPCGEKSRLALVARKQRSR